MAAGLVDANLQAAPAVSSRRTNLNVPTMLRMETWDLWYPAAASRGLSFARGAMEPADVVAVHAAPELLRVEVTDDDGRRVAFGDQLRRQGKDLPMTFLRKDGNRILREDRWPTAADTGCTVLLPGGEAGKLTAWWNAADGSEWRWSVEFYNRK